MLLGPHGRLYFQKAKCVGRGTEFMGSVLGFAQPRDISAVCIRLYFDRTSERNCRCVYRRQNITRCHIHIFSTCIQTWRCSTEGEVLQWSVESCPLGLGWVAFLSMGMDTKCPSRSMDVGQGCCSQEAGGGWGILPACRDCVAYGDI